MSALKRHIGVGVCMMYSGNRRGTSSQHSMWATAGSGEPWSWRNRQEPGLESSKFRGLQWLGRTMDEIVRQQKIKTRQFHLPLVDHQLQWLRHFLKMQLTPEGAVLAMKGVSGFINGLIILRLLPSALAVYFQR